MALAEKLETEKRLADDLENGILFTGVNGNSQTIFWGGHVPHWLLQNGKRLPYKAASTYATGAELRVVENKYGFPEGFLDYIELTSPPAQLKILSDWYKELDQMPNRKLRNCFEKDMPYAKANIATRILEERRKDPLSFLKEF